MANPQRQRVLIVEDEPTIGAIVKQRLETAGFDASWAKDGEEGLNRALAEEFHLLLLDVNLPVLSGFDVLSQLRAKGRQTPVIILSGDRLLEDRVRGLRLGADDYMTKPFDFDELLARMEAVMRRATDHRVQMLDVADMTLDFVARKVRRHGVDLELSDIEFRLLEYLARNKNRAVTRSEIARAIWGHENYKESNVIDVYMQYLRKTIDAGRTPPLITEAPGGDFQLRSH